MERSARANSPTPSTDPPPEAPVGVCGCCRQARTPRDWPPLSELPNSDRTYAVDACPSGGPSAHRSGGQGREPAGTGTIRHTPHAVAIAHRNLLEGPKHGAQATSSATPRPPPRLSRRARTVHMTPSPAVHETPPLRPLSLVPRDHVLHRASVVACAHRGCLAKTSNLALIHTPTDTRTAQAPARCPRPHRMCPSGRRADWKCTVCRRVTMPSTEYMYCMAMNMHGNGRLSPLTCLLAYGNPTLWPFWPPHSLTPGERPKFFSSSSFPLQIFFSLQQSLHIHHLPSRRERHSGTVLASFCPFSSLMRRTLHRVSLASISPIALVALDWSWRCPRRVEVSHGDDAACDDPRSKTRRSGDGGTSASAVIHLATSLQRRVQPSSGTSIVACRSQVTSGVVVPPAAAMHTGFD
ncbi:hypothetical protein RJ55_02792 [Drechmeria coniospora]|nr:hypothetical protein RJ55_02792 [Drechmeria coniospora]